MSSQNDSTSGRIISGIHYIFMNFDEFADVDIFKKITPPKNVETYRDTFLFVVIPDLIWDPGYFHKFLGLY